MTNGDKFKKEIAKKSNAGLAEILVNMSINNSCKYCIYNEKTCSSKCEYGIKAWFDTPCADEPENPTAIKDDFVKGIAKDLVDMLESMLTKKHKTVPRQKPDADNKEDIESLKELFKGAEIMNPIDWEILDIPAIGAETYLVVFNSANELVILDNEFMLSDIELLFLAQGRLFTDRWSAEMYLKKYKGVISAIKAQLQVLTKEDGL